MLVLIKCNVEEGSIKIKELKDKYLHCEVLFKFCLRLMVLPFRPFDGKNSIRLKSRQKGVGGEGKRRRVLQREHVVEAPKIRQ
eukprot:m.25745 g.25745  ORF g.25745 m.25745 type:complete len:83 (-) comp5798_c0_seq1:1820-2068(-)